MNPIPLTRPAPPAQLQRFGKYLLVRKLAEGGMAELFLAKQVGAEGFERDVVIKRMLPHLSRHPDFVGMFLDEARLAARLFHPNIVQITDLGHAEDRYFLCMEYLPGEDVEALITVAARRGEPVPVPVATRIILSACEGLEFAHGHREGGRLVDLVHRDVSPSNILVTYQGTVKVVDFGIAKASSRLVQTQPGTLKGKLGYMSPEQARGEPLDARSDLFSLGVTFYELLTGQRVFQRDTELGVLLALMEKPVPAVRAVRPDIPEALERIVMRMLARERERRYPSATELRADLEAFLSASSSVPGTTQLAQYMRGLFGAEQAQRRTQLPTLAELKASGVAVPPEEAEDALGVAPTLVRTPVPEVEAPAVDRAPAARRDSGLRGVALGALGAVLVLGAGAGALLVLRPQVLGGVERPAPTPEVLPGSAPAQAEAVGPREAVRAPEAAQGVSGASAAGDAPAGAGSPGQGEAPPGAALPAEAPAGARANGSDVPAPQAGTDAPPAQPEEAPAAERKRAAGQAVLLTEAAVTRALQREGRRILACATTHQAELPADGTVHMLFTVRNDGRVEEVGPAEQSQALQGKPLVTCFAEVLGHMRFPRNRNSPELVYSVPLRFR